MYHILWTSWPYSVRIADPSFKQATVATAVTAVTTEVSSSELNTGRCSSCHGKYPVSAGQSWRRYMCFSVQVADNYFQNQGTMVDLEVSLLSRTVSVVVAEIAPHPLGTSGTAAALLILHCPLLTSLSR